MKKNWDILVIDDEMVILDAVVKICSSEGYTVDPASDAREALSRFEKNNYKLIISDIMMPGIDGFGFLNELRQMDIHTPVIMTTGYSTVENAVKSLYTGAIDYIPKPFTADELINSVIRGIKYLEIQNAIRDYKNNEFDVIYVPCPPKYMRLGYSSWAAEESYGSVLVGASDLFLKTIENITDIEMIQVDEEVVQGSACAFIKDKEDRLHPLLSPLSGRIIEINKEIRNGVSLVEKDPYFQGWFYRLIPSDSEYEFKNLINCSSDRY